MKKYILALTATATLLGACEVDDKYYGKEVVDPAEKLEPAYGEDWTAHADKIDEKLIENFMNTDRGTFWYTDQDRTNESTYCYWPQAHAMDVLIDAYLRIPEGDARRDTYAGYMSKWYENKGNNYGNSYWGTYGFGNAYTDDSEWIILTLIRMYEATGVQKYLAAARKTYEETVIARWTEDENGRRHPLELRRREQQERLLERSGRPLRHAPVGQQPQRSREGSVSGRCEEDLQLAQLDALQSADGRRVRQHEERRDQWRRADL